MLTCSYLCCLLRGWDSLFAAASDENKEKVLKKEKKRKKKEPTARGKNPGGKATDNCCKYTGKINAHDPIYFINKPMVSRPRGLESSLS